MVKIYGPALYAQCHCSWQEDFGSWQEDFCGAIERVAFIDRLLPDDGCTASPSFERCARRPDAIEWASASGGALRRSAPTWRQQFFLVAKPDETWIEFEGDRQAFPGAAR
jgi:hypothetical protein